MKHQIDSKVRNMIRKPKRTMCSFGGVFDDALVQGYTPSITSLHPQGKRFWHYGKDLEAVRRMEGTFPARSIFIGAYFENNLIGIAKTRGRRALESGGLMQIVSMIQHRDKARQMR